MTIASVQTMHVPDGVTITQEDDWARNATKIRVTYENRQYEQYLTLEMIRTMPREQFQAFIDTMCARVMAKSSLIVMNEGLPQEDLPGGIVNWPVAIMSEGDFVTFTHPLHPGEEFQVRFLAIRGVWMHLHLEWPGHGSVAMQPVRASATYVREVIAEGMALASLLLMDAPNG